MFVIECLGGGVGFLIQAILCLVDVKSTKERLYISFIYASNSSIDRTNLWRDLEGHKRTVNSALWVIMRDFNVTLKPEEHSNSSSIMTSDMCDFRDTVNSLEVEDICSTGFQYTWTKSMKNPMCGTLKKLDRIMLNDEFLGKFGQAHGMFLPYLVSDHILGLLIIPNKIAKKKEVFQSNWSNGNIFEKVVSLKDKLRKAQSDVDADPFNKNKKEATAILYEEYSIAAEDEIKLLHQKAKINWLKEGDRNTTFFHKILKARKHKSILDTICGEDGATMPVIPLHTLGNIVNMKLTPEEIEYMVIEVTDEEIKSALFEIDSSKAAGPDYSACFYKKAWQIVRKEICLEVSEFFRTRRIFEEINATLIALVPKIDTPNVVSDFRPIACCNVLYKIISKILTDRIKSGLNKIVSLNQSAFIPGRHIQDNILIAQELLRGYNRKFGAKRCAMKIDLQKAYDTINWEFLKYVLHVVGFHKAMIN
ncbi:RNA-directed DNA polymerase, eukaryota, reverse transcriptase zinc-binding domain protein [Tanacetum coccineum]